MRWRGPTFGKPRTTIREAAYNAFTGDVTGYTDSAAGGLPQEKYGFTYDNAGEPTSLTGIWAYVNSLSHTELGQPQEYQMGSSSEPAYLVDSYDEETGSLTGAQTQTGTSPITVADQHYSYDNRGNVTSEADTPANGPAQAQCFQYDYLGRLNQAWSQGSSSCSSGPSQSAESGAAAPYWERYSYNTIGDMTSQTSTPASGAATTTTGSYPAAGSAQPHAVSAQQTSGPSGTTTTAYAYNAAGDLTSATGSSPAQNQSLSWDDAGRLSGAATAAGTTSYLYDADGNLLIQQDPGRVSLFLSDEELVLSTGTGTVTGTRYYTIGGQTMAARTASTAVDYLIPDREGTSLLSIDSQTLAVSQRYYDPYGNPVGTSPSTWPGEKGFVGGTADSATGLTNLGAREYSPSAGAFISPDPLLNPADPQDLNPYAYASDNPSTAEDPSGASQYGSAPNPCGASQSSCDPNGGGGRNPGAGGGSSSSPSPGRQSSGGSEGIVPISPHVYVSARDVQAPVLQAAWKAVVHRYGVPRSASDEYSDWWHLCALYPNLCNGELSQDFNPMADRMVGTVGLFHGGVDLIVTSVNQGTVLPAVIVGANYAQKWFNENFSAKGRFSGKNINEISDALREGVLTPEDVPVNIIIRSGNTLILNTRSAQALTRAGIERSGWTIIDRTGQKPYERAVNRQLVRNGLNEGGFQDPWSYQEFGEDGPPAGPAADG